jgi:hypothetical protein
VQELVQEQELAQELVLATLLSQGERDLARELA